MKADSRVLVRITIAALAVWLGAWAVWKGWTKHRLTAAKERVKQSGLPTSIDQLRSAAVADNDNAALPLLELGALLSQDTYRNSADGPSFEDRIATFKSQPVSHRLTSEEAKDLAVLLGDPVIAKMLELVSRAAARPGYDAKLAYEKGAEVIVPTVAPLRQAMILLGLQARLDASRGRFEEACANVWTMFTLADFVRDEPTLISALTRIACTHMAMESLERAVAEEAVNDAWSVRFFGLLSRLELRSGFVRALDGERVAFGGDAFEKLISGETSIEDALAMTEKRAGKVPMYIMKFFAADLLRLEYAEYIDRIRLFRGALAKLSPPYAESLQTLRDVMTIPRYHVLVNITLPTLNSVAGKMLLSDQKLSVAATGLALHRFALKHRRAAQSLEELVPDFMKDVPIDRFTGKPMSYLKDDRNAVVYSVGKNLRDDAGEFSPNDDKDDIAWRSPLPHAVE